jgi:acyl-CoA thioester hydrolase
MDNDVYGHVNNVVYYAYFDTAICRYLIAEAGIDIVNGPTLPFTVENGCRYHSPLAFPQVLEAGLGVARLGRSSVRYEIALFLQDQRDAAADGYFVDVFVDRDTHRSVPIPPKARAALERIVLDQRRG